MKKILIITLFIILAFSSICIVYGQTPIQQVVEGEEFVNEADVNGQLMELKEKTDNKVEEYIQKYGSKQYGYAAFALNAVRVYSIPVCFIGIIVSAIYQYIIGLKRLDIQEKGLHMMVGFITLLVICQILPLVFALVVLGWRN